MSILEHKLQQMGITAEEYETMCYEYGRAIGDGLAAGVNEKPDIGFDELARYVEAFELWREWLSKDKSPMIDVGSKTFCFFCGKVQVFAFDSEEDKPRHASSCVYQRAKKLRR